MLPFDDVIMISGSVGVLHEFANVTSTSVMAKLCELSSDVLPFHIYSL